MTRASRELAKITKERDVLRCIMDYLTVEGIWWMRTNAGEIEMPKTEIIAGWPVIGGTRKVRLAPAGTADLLAIVPRMRYGKFQMQYGWAIPFWIEVKRPHKATRSPEQIAFAEHMRSIGCLHVWAKDVEDVKAVLPPKMTTRNFANGGSEVRTRR